MMTNWNDIIKYATHGNLKPDKRVEKSEDDWRAILTAEQHRITRNKGTEMAGSGALCHAHDIGQYNCICCNVPLFDSTIKFNSGTGWPSFTEPIKNNVIKYIKDTAMETVRVEVQCNTCDAHLGHVFSDGPEPNGLRFCVNSESIKLIKG